MNVLDRLDQLEREPFVGDRTWMFVERAHLRALLDVASAAAESVDIGDEANRCRLCWSVWGKHEDYCPLVPLLKENT